MSTECVYIVRLIRDDSEIVEYESDPQTEACASAEATAMIDALTSGKHPGATVQVINIEHGYVLDEHYVSDGYLTANFPI